MIHVNLCVNDANYQHKAQSCVDNLAVLHVCMTNTGLDTSFNQQSLFFDICGFVPMLLLCAAFPACSRIILISIQLLVTFCQPSVTCIECLVTAWNHASFSRQFPLLALETGQSLYCDQVIDERRFWRLMPSTNKSNVNDRRRAAISYM